MMRATSSPILVVVGVSLGLMPSSANSKSDFDFEVKDQFDRPHSKQSVFDHRLVVLVGGDQKEETRNTLPKWLEALAPRLGDSVGLYGIIHPDGLPFFVPKSAVRSKLKERVAQTPVLIDFDGKIYRHFGFPKKNAVAVRVLGPDGSLVKAVNGPPSDAQRDLVLTAVEEELAAQ